MKRCFALVFVLFFSALAGRAQGLLEDQYVHIYNLVLEGDSLCESDPASAMTKYQEAQKELLQIQKGSPEWNAKVVNFRLTYVAAKIATLAAKLPAAADSKPANAPATAQAQPGQAAAPGMSEEELNGLREQVRLLQSDKQLLQAKLKEALALQPAAVESGQLAKAEEQLKLLQKENELLKVALENAKAVKPAPAADTQAVQQLNGQIAQQKERADKLAVANALLQKQLAEAQKKPSARGKATELEKQLAQAKTEITTLQSRLEVLEARQVPYTEEEKSLFANPAPVLAQFEVSAAKKPARKPSAETVKLTADARSYFSAGQYAKAEEAYQQVLRRDEKNVPALANLAVIQLQRNNLADAEANLNRALAIAPDDAYSLSVLGNIKFRQGKYDAALEALSRSAKLDPKDAETQNYLGLVLAEKGLRGPAESAFRKAIQLAPNYAGAHYNLAVYYATQQPPSVELARWHYEKALAAAQPHNPDVEKILNGKK